MNDLVAVMVLAGAIGYAVGLRRAWSVAGRGRLIRPGQACCFAAGAAVVLTAVVGPVDARSGGSLTAHMVQHLLLLVVAPPLLVMGAPALTLRWALSPAGRKRVDPLWRRALSLQRDGHWMASVLVATGIQTVALLAWHSPPLFDAALAHPAVHGLEHASFLGAAVLFWWTIVGAGRRARYGLAVLAVFVACLPSTALGAALVLAGRPWYRGYSLGDQQMAGVLMWSVGGAVSVIAAAALFRAWLQAMDRRVPSRIAA